MEHRIRAAGILVSPESQMLLVLEMITPGGTEIWVPPGGGLEPEDGSAIACVRREFQEETGLTVEVGPLLYVREFIGTGQQTHHLELFFLVHSPQGVLNDTERRDPPLGTDLMRHARWFTRAQLSALCVRPEVLQDAFWRDHAAGMAQAQYLGVSSEDIL